MLVRSFRRASGARHVDGFVTKPWLSRNAVNLELCLPDPVVLAPTSRPAPEQSKSQHAAPVLNSDALSRDSIFPVTLLRQGEGAEYTHRHHHHPVQGLSIPPQIQPAFGLNSMQCKAFAADSGEGRGCCESCEDCLEARRLAATEADEAFGDELGSGQLYSVSRFAPSRLRALVSAASLSFDEAQGMLTSDGDAASVARGAKGHSACGNRISTRVRYSLVLVTEDGNQAVLREVLHQAHTSLHARLAQLAATKLRRKNDLRAFPMQPFPPDVPNAWVLSEKDVDSSASRERRAWIHEPPWDEEQDPVQQLRLWLNSEPLASQLDQLLHALTGGFEAKGGSARMLRGDLRAAPTLSFGWAPEGCGRGGREAGGEGRGDGVDACVAECVEEEEERSGGRRGSELMTQVKGGEVWVWGGAVRLPLQSPPCDPTLGLVALGRHVLI
jgi:hypothetical protein